MSTISIHFELKSGLDQLAPQTREILGQVVGRTALAIERRAKQKVPVRFGHLKNSIRANVTAARSALRAEVEAGGTSQDGTPVEYAPHVEFGTIHQAAQPYFTPAVEAERQPFEAAAALAIEQGAQRAARAAGVGQ